MTGIKSLAIRAIVAGLLLGLAPAWAKPVVVKEASPVVTVDVPSGFVASDIDHGVQAKTPDDEIMVWFEVCAAKDLDTVLKEHDAYWTAQGVDLGGKPDHVDREVDGKTVAATDFKAATWKGKPTVVRYLLIDPALASKQVIVMSLWASPDGDKAHDEDVMKMISSLDVEE